MIIEIRHKTTYRFLSPVQLGEHRLRIRPRDSFDLRILDSGLLVEPVAATSWLHDPYGNPVCKLDFGSEAVSSLTIESTLLIERWQSRRATPGLAPWKPGCSVAYSDDERVALASFMQPDADAVDPAPGDFALDAVLHSNPLTQHPLTAVSDRIHETIRYQMRMEEGTQAPRRTMELASGACRDMAWLFIAAARQLGYAARFVTGYLHAPDPGHPADLGPDQHTHAWAEAYLPGDGWVEFDPTNRLVGDCSLVRVAVTRTPDEAVPVSGTFFGLPQRVSPVVKLAVEARQGMAAPPIAA